MISTALHVQLHPCLNWPLIADLSFGSKYGYQLHFWWKDLGLTSYTMDTCKASATFKCCWVVWGGRGGRDSVWQAFFELHGVHKLVCLQIQSLVDVVNEENKLRSEARSAGYKTSLKPDEKEVESKLQDIYEQLHPGRRNTVVLGGHYPAVVMDAKPHSASPTYRSAVFLVPKVKNLCTLQTKQHHQCLTCEQLLCRSNLIWSMNSMEMLSMQICVCVQGRAHEWLFSSEEGQWQVLESAQAGRLILVEWHSHSCSILLWLPCVISIICTFIQAIDLWIACRWCLTPISIQAAYLLSRCVYASTTFSETPGVFSRRGDISSNCDFSFDVPDRTCKGCLSISAILFNVLGLLYQMLKHVACFAGWAVSTGQAITPIGL